MSEPSTRWSSELGAAHSHRYVERMRALAADGADLDGEARLVDVLVPRDARVLDAGCGTGRVGAALGARGHHVTGVDLDPVLVEAARQDHPGCTWLVGDLVGLDLGDASFDAAVLAGNVLVYVAPGTERDVLRSVARLVRPGGVVVTGFATDRDYATADLDRDCAAEGLVLEHRFSTWDLRPWTDDAGWAVSVLRVGAGVLSP